MQTYMILLCNVCVICLIRHGIKICQFIIHLVINRNEHNQTIYSLFFVHTSWYHAKRGLSARIQRHDLNRRPTRHVPIGNTYIIMVE